ncbi:hypothetical protein Aconfl_23570 [Algoriphagus confluentis]|uniref:Uncharacterized protein n=1 Tax=Algoriphagus confluentis TaxID=1697556 RepID=A0ABQ6PP16_9BACT|nr:hypothetical protein Aconfl_23570 [Algoriphagus confluentis]
MGFVRWRTKMFESEGKAMEKKSFFSLKPPFLDGTAIGKWCTANDRQHYTWIENWKKRRGPPEELQPF